MSENADSVDEVDEEPVKKRSKLPLLLSLVFAMVGGGGGFYAVQSGLILADEDKHEDAQMTAEPEPEKLPDIAFVPITPLIVSLGPNAQKDHLRFRAELEVKARYADEVRQVLPRVVDVLNGYLRAVSLDDIQDPGSLFRLRAQMLRRVQIVTGEGRVNDLLVMEFVLN